MIKSSLMRPAKVWQLDRAGLGGSVGEETLLGVGCLNLSDLGLKHAVEIVNNL